MLTFSNQDAQGVVAQNLGAEGEAELDGLDFLPFENLEQGVKDDVTFLKGSKAIPDSVNVTGWIYEVETGKVKPVL